LASFGSLVQGSSSMIIYFEHKNYLTKTALLLWAAA